MKLYDALLKKTKDELKDLAQGVKLRGISNLKKLDLAYRISNQLINDEELLGTMLYFFNDKCHSLLKRVLREKTHITEGNLKQFLILTRYGFVYQEEEYMLVPEDLAMIIQKVITKEFYTNHKKAQWLFSCAVFASDFYGIFTLYDFIDLLKLNKKEKYSYETATVIDEFLMDFPMAFKQGDEYISVAAEDYGIERLRLQQKGKNKFIPTKEEISFYFEKRYLSNPYYQTLFSELKRRTGDTFVSEVIIQTFFSKALLGEDADEAVEYLTYGLQPVDELDVTYLVSVAIQAYNNTNMITNRGKTPLQTRKEQNK